VLIGTYVVHKVAERLRRRRLRRSYDRIVARVPAGVRLGASPIDLSPARELPSELRDAAELVRREGEAIVAGTVDFLGSGPVFVGREIDWHTDFKSGYRWSPTTFYQDLEITRLTDASDAKVPWELSRGHQFLTLARAATLFEQDRFADELERQLAHWIAENPPGFGINWTNPMEVAIRAVNWIWAIRTLEASRPLNPRLRAIVTASLQAHARHLATNPEGSPLLRSNHYLSDILGLLALGAYVNRDRSARRWLTRARLAFERQILDQVLDDGVGFEASTSYHGLALEIFLIAKHIAREVGQPFSRRYDLRLGQMLEVSRSIRHPDGRIPLFGDGDSGRVLPGGFARPPTHDPLLWLGAALLGRQAPLEGPPAAEVAWTLGMRAWEAVAEGASAGEPPAAFQEGGLYVLRGDGVHAVVRCGDLGQNGAGGHGHNDVLSYEFGYSVPLVVDSGTYAYTSDPAARNRFRSTAAHNSVVVDGTEINPLPDDDMFHLPQLAHPVVESWDETPRMVRLVASHDGYREFPGGVTHRRALELHRTTGELSVIDELQGSGYHRAESFVHLAPATRVVRRKGSLAFDLVNGKARARITFWGFNDSIELTDGWVSSEFGRRERAAVLVARWSGSIPTRFGYTLTGIRQTEKEEMSRGLVASR
jgi:hypothetical protein